MKKTVQVDQEEYRSQDNLVDRPLVTFDANIVIALRNDEANAQPARHLLALNHAGVVTVNVTLSTALEEQRPDEEQEMHEYAAWLQEQGIAPGNIFTYPLTIGFQLPGDLPGTTTFSPLLENDFNRRIHTILFPNIPFSWVEYYDQQLMLLDIQDTRQKALIELNRQNMYLPIFSPQAPAQLPTPVFDSLEQAEQEEVRRLYKQLHQRWMNAKNDALGLYNHLSQAAHTTYPEQAVFVTNDRNFLKQTRTDALRKLHFPGKILRPTEAIAFLHTLTKSSSPDL